ncbi:MAG: marine proteobacterial sortase target protein [Marinobacter excellens HL-55]|uniref:Marine proteobacterial sortase target protein n=1 Tax=Marinobacter excellens HL-55 TaxID=1305731 RepID=A0A0P8CZQ1_9GAMM|nr:MAG: marine proteobacterial sortase target protein [Marinobacter excellens HL-55]
MMLLSLLANRDGRIPLESMKTIGNRANRPRMLRCAEGVSLWLAMLMMLFVHPIYAEARAMDMEQPGQLYLMDGQNAWQQPALILDSDFSVQVSGLLAQTTLTRAFRNTSDRWLEGVFVFPLPDKATVYGLTMTVGEREVVGRIEAKASARQTYERAKAAGQHAATLEQQRPNLFTSRVANIPPGETVRVEIRYQQVLDYRQGEFELRLPTTLTPRYMPGEPVTNTESQWQSGWAVPTTQVPDAGDISPFTVRPSDVDRASHRAAIDLTIDSGLALASVTSPSHRLHVEMDGSRAQVRPEQGKVLMDRDVIVRWRPVAGSEPSAAVFHQQWQGEDYLMAMVLPPESVGPVLRRELSFVIDTSGSMAGDAITQARSALLRGLDTLRPGDTFNVIQFNSQAHALFPAAVPAQGHYLARARRYVQDLQANGGTEMAGALSLAMSMDASADEEQVRQLVFITDGAVGNEAALFDQIRSGLNNRRLFTVGIGSAPNMHFLREAARWGRGEFTAIHNSADVDQALNRLFAAMEAPVLTSLDVRWPDQGQPLTPVPARPGDLFRGTPLIQVVKGLPASGVLHVSGQLPGGRDWHVRLDLANSAPAGGLNRQWARGRIDELIDAASLQRTSPDQDYIVDLSTRHSVISPFTSFVAVEKRKARPEAEVAGSEAIPTLLPAGSQSGMLRYPQTATFGPLFTALGLVGLMFALAIAMLSRRQTL